MLFKLCLFRHLAQCTLFLLTLYFFHSNSHVIGNESIPFWSLKFVTPGHNSLSEKLSRFEPFHSFHQLLLRPRICMKYFLSFPQKNRQQRKLRQTKCLLFNSFVIRFTLIPKKSLAAWLLRLAIFDTCASGITLDPIQNSAPLRPAHLKEAYTNSLVNATFGSWKKSC